MVAWSVSYDISSFLNPVVRSRTLYFEKNGNGNPAYVKSAKQTGRRNKVASTGRAEKWRGWDGPNNFRPLYRSDQDLWDKIGLCWTDVFWVTANHRQRRRFWYFFIVRQTMLHFMWMVYSRVSGWGQVPLSEKSKSKTQVWSKTQLKTELDLATKTGSKNILGLRIFLDRILVLDFCLSRDLSSGRSRDGRPPSAEAYAIFWCQLHSNRTLR